MKNINDVILAAVHTHTHIYSNEIKNANNKISNKSYASYKTKIAGITLN